MMILLSLPLFIRLVVILPVLAAGCYAAEKRLELPYDYVHTNKVEGLTFAFQRERDLRLVFSSQESLQSRIAKQVCVFDLVGIPLQKEISKVESKEISVGSGLSMRAILDLANVHWNGGQPQLKLIKRNAILQSPIGKRGDFVVRDSEGFLQLRVEPGDIVILALVVE